jgi:hypothetical protein
LAGLEDRLHLGGRDQHYAADLDPLAEAVGALAQGALRYDDAARAEQLAPIGRWAGFVKRGAAGCHDLFLGFMSPRPQLAIRSATTSMNSAVSRGVRPFRRPMPTQRLSISTHWSASS